MIAPAKYKLSYVTIIKLFCYNFIEKKTMYIINLKEREKGGGERINLLDFEFLEIYFFHMIFLLKLHTTAVLHYIFSSYNENYLVGLTKYINVSGSLRERERRRSRPVQLVDRIFGEMVWFTWFVCRGARCNNLLVISGLVVSHGVHQCELGYCGCGTRVRVSRKINLPGNARIYAGIRGLFVLIGRTRILTLCTRRDARGYTR